MTEYRDMEQFRHGWDELDDLVAQQFAELDQRRTDRRGAARTEINSTLEDDGREALSVLADGPDARPSDDISDPGEPATGEDALEGDEYCYLELCHILGTASDPCRLIERLVADMPQPRTPNELPEPGESEVRDAG